MAAKITGGGKTDEALGKNGGGPEGLPHSIIVTPDGIEGEVPVVSSKRSAGGRSAGGGAGGAERQSAIEDEGQSQGAKRTARTPARRRRT